MYLNNLQSFIFSTIIILFLGFVACEKTKEIHLLEKDYSGTFYLENSKYSYGPSSFVLKVKDGKYQFIPDEDSPMRGGSGTFSISENNTLQFKDENMWTADFDWNFIFSGSFSVTEDQQHYILSKKLDDNSSYIYRLEK